MIAAPHGRSGKTVLTLGLLRALANRGVAVQPFKKGPDYIDTGWHSVAARRESRNLDCFFMEPPVMRRVLCEAAGAADGATGSAAGSAAGAAAELCVVEGAMGLFDGLDVEGTSSSAQVAKDLGLPVVLVVDVTRMTRTTAAIVQGLACFDRDVHVAGVLLNRVQGARQERLVRAAVERYCDIPVLGALPKDERMRIPDRHLGLTSNTEASEKDAFLDGIARVVEEHVDLDALLGIAACAPELEGAGEDAEPSSPGAPREPRVTVAVVRDRAFSFYYPENLQALEAAGADLVFVDSLADAVLPADACGLYVGGGFPEVFAAQLEANAPFRASVRAFAERGFPVYAECGGLMFLARTLRCDGRSYDMAGVLDLSVAMEEKRQGHGYAVVVAGEDHPWLPAGTVLKGHEHHHSHVVERGADVRLVCANERGRGIAERRDGACRKRVVAGYTHVNALASPTWAPGFVAAARTAAAEDNLTQ